MMLSFVLVLFEWNGLFLIKYSLWYSSTRLFKHFKSHLFRFLIVSKSDQPKVSIASSELSLLNEIRAAVRLSLSFAARNL